MVTARRLRAAPFADCAGYHVICNRIICRVSVMAVTAASQAGLKWSRVHIVIVGCMFVSVGCHVTSKGAELSCDLDYAISFWSWIIV